MTNDAPAVITIREVYDLVLEVRSEVAGQGIPDIRFDVQDHETRIRSLERWIWRASGIAATFGAVGGAILNEMIARSGN